MDTFRWAYIGSGNIARNTAKSITKGDHKITAVYSRNPETAKAFAASCGATVYSTAEQAMAAADVDGVYIATPHTSHCAYALQAIRLGKPVLCEKPVGVSAAEADAMIRAAQEHGVYFCEAMWTWFSDVALTVRQWVQSGRIGDVQRVEMDYAFPGMLMQKSSRVRMPETAGGALLDIGIYPVTYCYNLFGYPKSIHCDGRLQDGIDVSETVTLGYDGFSCVLRTSLTSLKERCVIKGSRGSIRLDWFHMASKAVLKTDEGKEVFRGKTDYLTQFTRAAQEIRAGKTASAYIPPEATRDCLRILDVCRAQMGLVYPFERSTR